MVSRAVLVVALLLLPSLAFAPSATACTAAGVPCGRIYPQILIRIPDQQPVYNVTMDEPLVLDAELVFTFDMDAEGYTVPTPNEEISIGFEFPRKPKWEELAVDPPRIAVPVGDPRYVTTDTSSGSPQAQFVYRTPITITATQVGQGVLKDGYDYAKLLVFAKSTESGLYQAGYGIKEIRVAPEGALHESDLAGSRDVFTAVPLAPLDVAATTGTAAGVTVSLDAVTGKFWEPLAFTVGLSPAPADGRMVLAVHDERGDLVAQAGPMVAAASATFNVTLAKPGHHTLTATLLPEGAGVPLTVPVPFVAGDLAPDGFRYPKAYLVTTTQTVPAPDANQADPLAQFERDIPFFAFDSAQSVSVSITLVTPGTPLPFSLANLQYTILDPEGKQLAAGSVDPTVPVKGSRIGSLTTDGWFVLRVSGAGLPQGASYNARIEVAYASEKEARDLADGLPDATGGLLGLGGLNLTLPTDALALWTPTPVTPALDRADAKMRYQMTIYDANGTLAYASTTRQGSATFSPPAPETYRAYVFVEPVAPSTAFPPVVRAFTFGVGNDTTTTLTTFQMDDVYELPVPRTEARIVGIQQVRSYDLQTQGGWTAAGVTPAYASAEAAAPEGALPESVDLSALGDGGVTLVYLLSADPPETEGIFEMSVDYADAVTLAGPDAAAPQGVPDSGRSIGALPLVGLLAVVGLVAVVVALTRRK